MRQALACLLLLITGWAWAGPDHDIVPFDELVGWTEDDQSQSLEVFRQTCARLDGRDWQTLCAMAQEITDGRAFFESFFLPVYQKDGTKGHFTGYFEPELAGSRVKSAAYPYPVYRMPAQAKRTRPWLTRNQIETSEALSGRGLEIAYVSDPVDLFYMQVQGSGRIRLPDNEVIRLGYGGSNGHEYSSIGTRLASRGYLGATQLSQSNIRRWVRNNPVLGLQLLRETDGYVFFKELDLATGVGPIGALSASLTPLRSIAVDPDHVPLGAPVWLQTKQSNLARLMIAQDVGSAIKGVQRADIFFGAGEEAGRQAWQVSDNGRMVVLLPIQRALSLVSDQVQ